MKVKVITITGESNYGNSLQNYAVIQTLNRLGCEAQTVKTEYEPNFTKLCKKNLKIYTKVALKIKNYHWFKRQMRFKKFSNRYLCKTEKVYSETAPTAVDDCDAIIFGSDQIWNFTLGERMKNGISFYTGGFDFNGLKIAYSASVGADYIPEDFRDIMSKNLSSFAAISVREQQARDIVGSVTDVPVDVTVDPTLMLDKSQWLKIAKKPKYVHNGEHFVFTYFLGTQSDSVKDYISAVGKKYNLRVISLQSEWTEQSDIFNVDIYSTSPDEFLWLVANCDIVFTDSFHGSVFSIINEKPFRFFDRNTDFVGNMSSRLDTLFDKFQIDSWCRGNTAENIDDVFYKNYSNVPQTLSNERAHALSYLKNALGI